MKKKKDNKDWYTITFYDFISNETMIVDVGSSETIARYRFVELLNKLESFILTQRQPAILQRLYELKRNKSNNNNYSSNIVAKCPFVTISDHSIDLTLTEIDTVKINMLNEYLIEKGVF